MATCIYKEFIRNWQQVHKKRNRFEIPWLAANLGTKTEFSPQNCNIMRNSENSFCYSDGTSNRAVFEHLNTELVRYSDSYSIFVFHFRSNSKARKLRMPEEWRKNFSFSSFEIFLTRNTECSRSTKKLRPFGKNRHKADLFIKRSDPVVFIKLFLYLHFSLFWRVIFGK